MSNINLKNNVIYYFLISSLKPLKKIYELINTNDRETYIEAHEILGIYANKNNFIYERIKIESRENSFHIFVTKEDLIYISYSNKRYFSSEQNFQLFDEINDYLLSNLKERSLKEHSFLIEDEKEDIKDIINKFLGEVFSLKSIDSFSASAQTENEKDILQVNSNDDINNNINEEQNYENIDLNKNNSNRNNNITIKKILKNYSHSTHNELTEKALQDKISKKNESSEEDILKNKNINNSSVPYVKSNKSNNILLKSESKPKIKISSRTLFSNNSKIKLKKDIENSNDIKEKPKSNLKYNYSHTMNKNYSYNKFNYNNINFKKNKPDCCSKTAILVILISVIVLQIATIPLIIKFYDFSV